LGLHTLSLVNYMMGAYFFFVYQQQRKRTSALLSLFFILSAIASFYGLGLLVFLGSIFVYKFSLRSLLKSLIIIAFVFVLFATTLYAFKKETFFYNLENLRRAELFFRDDISEQQAGLIPRKLLLFKNYFKGYSEDPILFLLGSGPGTFNSRTYFLLNGDYSRNKSLEKIFGVSSPKMGETYVHPLWNKDNTGLYTDGTRNEPFSTVIAMLAEYGFLISLLIAILCLSKYRSIISLNTIESNQHLIRFLRFISIFLVINFLTDNFLEYPEIMLIYLLMFKLIEIKRGNVVNKLDIIGS